MAINFPDSPTSGDTHTVGDKTWTWNGTSWDVVVSTPISNQIIDADGDTRIHVEESPDEDYIRFDTAGTERMTIGPTGDVAVVNDLSVTGTISGGSTSFPTSLDSGTMPAIEALQAKVGADSSAVTSSHDYILSNGVLPTLNVDSGVLVVDDTNNRVGINDSTPSYALDVTGDINTSGDLRIGGAVAGEYIDYSASQTFGGFTLGNGTCISRYARFGDMIHWWGYVILGTTSSMSGALDPAVPVTGAFGLLHTRGQCYFNNQVNGYPGHIIPLSGTTVRFQYWNFGSPAVYAADVTSGLPFSWANNHIFSWNLFYEAA